MIETHSNPSRAPRRLLRPSDFEHRTMRVDTLSMHVVVAGPEDGPLVLLLHGFGEFWYFWRYQIRALGEVAHIIAPQLDPQLTLTPATEPPQRDQGALSTKRAG